jgi:cellulose synthase/poly-beta-1,6-N-acetylglucosamine synthase-like glycosyltransferase
VRLEPGFLALTAAPETVPAWLRQRRRWIGGALETLLRHRSMVGDRRYGLLGGLQLVHTTLLLPQPIWLAALLPLGLLHGGNSFVSSFLPLATPVLLARYLLNLLFALARLGLYRCDVGRRGSSYAGALADALLAPLTYAFLQVPAHLWGYASALRRRGGW